MRNRYLTILIMLAVTILGLGLCASAQTYEPNKPELVQKTVTVDFRDVAVKDAIRMLFEGTGLKHIVESGVTGTVNATLVEVPFAQAVQAVLRSANMQMIEEDGIFVIGPQRAEPVAPVVPPIQINEVQLKPQTVIEKIPVGYMDVFEMLSYLQGGGSRSGGGAAAGSGPSIGGGIGGGGNRSGGGGSTTRSSGGGGGVNR